jgi:hypothetical protein
LEDDTRPGAVKFENDIRASSDVPRIGARSDIKMEAGRLICNSSAVNADEYCDDQVVQDGFSNKGATVSHDWDHDYNDTPREDLIEDDDPDNKISDTTETRSVSLELSAAPDGLSGTIGYSSSVAVPGADIVDETVQSTGQTRHELQVSNSGEDSATTTAEFEIGNTAEWNPSCESQSGSVNYLDINVDLEWGLGLLGGFWGVTVSNSKEFLYYTYCY